MVIEWNIVHLTDLQVNTCVLSQKLMLREKRQVTEQYEQCGNYLSFKTIENDTKYYQQLTTQRVKVKSKNKKHGYNKQQIQDSSYFCEKKTENGINNPKRRLKKYYNFHLVKKNKHFQSRLKECHNLGSSQSEHTMRCSFSDKFKTIILFVILLLHRISLF